MLKREPGILAIKPGGRNNPYYTIVPVEQIPLEVPQKKIKTKKPMKPEKIIKEKLYRIEEEHNVKILYAVESGSRAWGFESTDSDYDVRFIYKHNLEWNLNVLPKRDVIEYPIDGLFDYSGWDLRKTPFLLNKSNPVLFEWLQSPLALPWSLKSCYTTWTLMSL